jgi:hypothetical protein
MSLPLSTFDWWETGTTQPSIPVNNNALRTMIGMSSAVSDSVTAQPALTTPDDDGLWYIIPSGATGSQWATFSQYSAAIFFGGNWYEFTPQDGDILVIEGNISEFSPSNGWTVISSGGGVQSVSAGAGIAVDNSDPDNPVISLDNDVTAATSNSGVLTIDCATGDYFTHALDENVTSWSFTNLPGSGKGATKMIRFTQDSTPRTVAWPASFRWAGGTDGVISTGSGAIDVLAITTFDNGTTWIATLNNAFAA